MESPLLKPMVTLSGTAEEGAVGPPLGLVDIGICESAYLFRVALPGVRGSESKLKCNIQLNGRVHIEGVITESQFMKNCSKVFEMKVQQLCPTGPFSVSFNLPGPVDPRLCSFSFKAGGIFEVVVLKFRIPHLSAEGWFEKWYDCWSFP
ncbi:increased DNA methylation 3 [Coffea arabica]|uniref:Increased DNA methylation 3 n=1 Tax=Coffea arabica TaxID=13443 RepID=A0A6P6SAR8_COFAR